MTDLAEPNAEDRYLHGQMTSFGGFFPANHLDCGGCQLIAAYRVEIEAQAKREVESNWRSEMVGRAVAEAEVTRLRTLLVKAADLCRVKKDSCENGRLWAGAASAGDLELSIRALLPPEVKG